LSGCALLSQHTDSGYTDVQIENRWQQRSPRLAAVTAFTLDGRISTGALLGASGTLNWRQTGEAFEALFSGALGVGAIRVTGDRDALTVQTREGQYDKRAAEALLRERLGWTPPWSSLRYWILGEPAPDTSSTIGLDAEGRLASLEQQGWHIEYAEYRATPAFPLDLPRKLTLTHMDQTLRLVVDQWAFVTMAQGVNLAPAS